MLLERDANVNAKDAFEWTTLHWAAVNGRLVAARLLLENGAQVGRENREGWTALHFAVSQGHNAATRLLLDRGADPWSVDVENVWN
jgi:ankyrin repeat protein